MLIDNVGLHRIFGLPVRDRDWEAMFEGRMAGNAQPRTRMENNGLSVSVPLPEDGRRNEELEVVMTHNCLLDAVRNGDLVRLGEDGPAGGEQRTCNLQIFLCLFLEKLNMPQNTPVTKAS